ncbi:AAA family ATPase, partial [Faunimonas sp. B44]|uniref:AAA family ATPase n=1 Tax=Faunimonas sp. B44 TaxID=3461493 RepID=UPI004043B906
MLKSLSYSVTFASTGRSLSGQIDFQKGFGAVTGPNEAGKSFIIEMIRYCLFGSAALRGEQSGYQKLRAELEWCLRGEDYKVVRNTSPKLYRGDEVIAVGTKPINVKIAELFGYGLTVFDTAHVANQGDIEKLGSMKPAERKRMVDSVIG